MLMCIPFQRYHQLILYFNPFQILFVHSNYINVLFTYDGQKVMSPYSNDLQSTYYFGIY